MRQHRFHRMALWGGLATLLAGLLIFGLAFILALVTYHPETGAPDWIKIPLWIGTILASAGIVMGIAGPIKKAL